MHERFRLSINVRVAFVLMFANELLAYIQLTSNLTEAVFIHSSSHEPALSRVFQSKQLQL